MMLSIGFLMLSWPGSLYELKVGPMVCIRPIDGWPAAAFESQLFWALGLPPDSYLMIIAMSAAFILLIGTPCGARIFCASEIHWPTVPPTLGCGPETFVEPPVFLPLGVPFGPRSNESFLPGMLRLAPV